MNTVETLKQAVLEVPESRRLRVAERFDDNDPSQSIFTWIESAQGQLALREEGAPSLPIERGYVASVFERYALPLEGVGNFTARMLIPGGAQLLHMLYVPEFDVVPKDYLVWIPEPDAYERARVELCVLLVPPLLHLAKALARKAQASN